MPNTYHGVMTNNGGDKGGTWNIPGGASGSYQILEYTPLNADTVSFKERLFASDGSLLGDVEGVLTGNLSESGSEYTGTWSTTENDGKYFFRNFKDGKLIGTGEFTTPYSKFQSYIESGGNSSTFTQVAPALSSNKPNANGSRISLAGTKADYKFINLGSGRYGIQQKDSTKIDEITGASTVDIGGSTISVANDVKGVFDHITGKETQDAKVFRLYNAAFARFPDATGLHYWMQQLSSGAQDYNSIAQSFINSNEFKTLYGSNNSNGSFVENLYKNILGRTPDQPGLQYWTNVLNQGLSSRAGILGGFSESTENKALFTEVTGFA